MDKIWMIWMNACLNDLIRMSFSINFEWMDEIWMSLNEWMIEWGWGFK